MTLKNNQYFVAAVGSRVFIGQVKEDKNTFYLMNNMGVGVVPSYNTFDYGDFTFAYEVENDDVELDEAITAFKVIPKATYVQYKDGKGKGYAGFAKAFLAENNYGVILGHNVRRKGDAFVFGCGEVVLRTKEIATFVKVIEAVAKAGSSDEFDVVRETLDNVGMTPKEAVKAITAYASVVDMDGFGELEEILNEQDISFDRAARDLKRIKSLLA